ncbi:MAG: hypothetical protein CEN88_433 [Candidatus Berkelbacteria bacterium Licking1014_2]|uniref:Uncharacterized protein n=1 Tax=Candidatus Berkelbacteria bacterium Licking1014_2 TaxID=2017146 RepID=A0A554LSB1_9BACT|nr:MAG: hypothetical protein CEN88_433 [Candidatus Berkelbacteria bacterium Licking1014_2]
MKLWISIGSMLLFFCIIQFSVLLANFPEKSSVLPLAIIGGVVFGNSFVTLVKWIIREKFNE